MRNERAGLEALVAVVAFVEEESASLVVRAFQKVVLDVTESAIPRAAIANSLLTQI